MSECKQGEWHAEGEAGLAEQGAPAGLDPRTLRLGPELKADTLPTELPRRPFFFLRFYF